jgi:hypothetical protein
MGVDTETHYFSGSKDYVAGPTLEVHLPLSFSVEFDALYRPLNLTVTDTIIPDPALRSQTPVPSLRTTQSFPGDSPHLARAGFTAGVGVEGKPGPIRISPGIRYTRWDADSNVNLSAFDPQSNVDQVELLVGLNF